MILWLMAMADHTCDGFYYLFPSVDLFSVAAITINFKGGAEVKWQETSTSKDAAGKETESTTHYTGDETYFENKYYLLGSASGTGMSFAVKGGMNMQGGQIDCYHGSRRHCLTILI